MTAATPTFTNECLCRGYKIVIAIRWQPPRELAAGLTCTAGGSFCHTCRILRGMRPLDWSGSCLQQKQIFVMFRVHVTRLHVYHM